MKASQTETVIMLTCCALQSACYSPTGIVISFILAQFQGEVQTNLTVKRFLMCSAALCTYSAERIIYNFAFVALCGALQTHFHRRGRNGKRHLQRRFLRKRGAAGKCCWSAPSQSKPNGFARFPLLSLRDIFPRSGGSLSSKGEPRALPETFSLHLIL